ncbi:hypothetical protein CRYUN_Cryun33cG0088500 [Craigia yunnanensis]
MAQLGWIAGVGTLLLFSCITYYGSSLLADCYRSPNSTSGKRNYSYMEAVKTNLVFIINLLGGIKYKACGFLQYTFLSGMLVGYTITASVSMVAIRKSNCFHKKGHGASCKFSNNPYMIAFGIVEIFVSQIPNFHQLSWLSFIAAIMSFGYAFIGMGLAFAKVISGNGARTILTGVGVGVRLNRSRQGLEKVYSSRILFYLSENFQDTLKSSPPENKDMKKANMIGMFTSTTLYLLCSCLGYAAFGNHAPVFSVVESWISSRWPTSNFVTEEYPISIARKKFSINLLRLIWRTLFVVVGTVVAMTLPFFNDIIAFLGAIGYWPMTVYFPVEMHIAQKKIKQGTIRWLSLQLLNLVCLLVSVAAAAGAIQGLSHDLQTSKLFNFKY